MSPRGGPRPAIGSPKGQLATTLTGKANSLGSGTTYDPTLPDAPPVAWDLSDMLKPLCSTDPHVRQAACQTLGKADCRSDTRILTALSQRLQADRDVYVRQAAASALGQAARKGDDVALTAVLQRAPIDSDAGVRRLGCLAIGQIAPRNHQPALAVLLGRLDDKDGGVRRSAIKSLEKVAERGDAQVISTLFAKTADSEAYVRHTAVEALGKLAEEGSPEVVARMLELLHSDRDARVRWSATDGLGRIAARGDSRVLTSLMARLDDSADSVRRAAASALGRVTFAPLQELELQERHIQELEHSGRSEVNSLQAAIHQMREAHAEEVAALKERIADLEDEVADREARIDRYEADLEEQGRFCRVGEFLPAASAVTRFLDTLPALASPAAHGTEIIAPVWALRCVRAMPSTGLGNNNPRGGAPNARIDEGGSPSQGVALGAGKDKRELLELFELFEQLSTGKVTPMELTETKPLDIYIHRADTQTFGVYCCSRHRLLALLMYQACCRNECLMVRCIVRPKDDCGYWGWHWNNFYDGGEGLNVHLSPRRAVSGSGSSAGFSMTNLREGGTPMSPPARTGQAAVSRRGSEPGHRSPHMSRGGAGGNAASGGTMRAGLSANGTPTGTFAEEVECPRSPARFGSAGRGGPRGAVAAIARGMGAAPRSSSGRRQQQGSAASLGSPCGMETSPGGRPAVVAMQLPLGREGPSPTSERDFDDHTAAAPY